MVLNEPQLKLVEAKHVRWLSHAGAVSAISCLPSILLAVDNKALARGSVIGLQVCLIDTSDE